ncbi:MAG: TlpA family protein disulfide reductase [Planctomycetes bacterium]|nr:TlpA family protein disulfide reductase [Planctomycetota bacterium]
MRKKDFLISILLIAALFGCPRRDDSSKAKEPTPYDIAKITMEEKAPDFTLKDLNGREIKLSDYKGKTVMLVFSTTWCPHCREEIPHLKEVYSKYPPKDFTLLNIDVQESHEKVSSFVKANEIPYPVLLDEKGAVAAAYNVAGVPNIMVVDKNGVIVCKSCRGVDTILNSLLSGR